MAALKGLGLSRKEGRREERKGRERKGREIRSGWCKVSRDKRDWDQLVPWWADHLPLYRPWWSMWLRAMKVAQSCLTLCDPVNYTVYSPWNFPGQNTGVGSHSLLQGFFLIQGSNPGLPHCRRIPYQLHHQGSLELSKCQGCSDAQSFCCILMFHWVLLQQYQVLVVIQFTFIPSRSPQLETRLRAC